VDVHNFAVHRNFFAMWTTIWIQQNFVVEPYLSVCVDAGAKVISAETVPLRRGPSLQFDPDATLHVKGTTIGQELLVLRIFLDGYYSEPPSEVLPPVPMIAPAVNDGCCTLL